MYINRSDILDSDILELFFRGKMVLKFGKRGVRSGNTLKTPSVQFLRSYRKNAYIIREDTDVNGGNITNERLGVDDIHSTSVPYSLNKKSRWLLPTKLMNAIKQGQFHFEEYGVKLLEKHNIKNTNANCVSAYFSKGPIKEATVYKRSGKRKRRRTGYMCGDMLQNNSNLSRRKMKKLRRQGKSVYQDATPNEVNENRQVTFEVMYPSPLTSSLTHSTDNIGYNTEKEKTRSKNKRLRKKNQDIIHFDTSYLNIEQEISDDELEFSDNDSQEGPHEKLDFQTLISHAVRNDRKTRKVPDDFTKDFVFVPRPVQLVSAESLASDDHFVRVILKQADIHPNQLNTLYDSSYVECDCFPRKFVIDITADVKALDVFKIHWKENIKSVHACVVFLFDLENDINTEFDGVYKVYLNTSLTNAVSTTRIETLFDYTETDVAECLNSSLFYIETLPNLVQTQATEIPNRKIIKQLLIEEFNDWRSTVYIPNDEFHFNSSLTASQKDGETINMKNLFSVERHDKITSLPEPQKHLLGSENEHICSICYTDIGFGAPGTALRKCGHWFCNQCWEAHLTTQVTGGSLVMECPQFSCKTPVDIGTMMTLLCLRDILQHTRACHDMDVDRHEETKWCPNKKCGRVLKVNSTDAPLINCDCGQRVCFKCLGKSHWPASCQSAKIYRHFMHDIEMEDDKQVLIAVNGMQCPHCHRFFEKIAGCPYMYCLCRKSFCWGCGRDWYKFTHGNNCSMLGEKIVHGRTKSMFIYTGQTSLKKPWVDTALEHHLSKDSKQIRELEQYLKGRSKKIISYMNKTSNTISLDFKGSKSGYTKESQKVPEFLQNLLDIKTELHFIAENIAILLGSEVAPPLRKYFTNLIKKLAHNCTLIEECISYPDGPSDVLRLIRKMKCVRSSCLKLLKSTAHHVQMLNL